MNYRSSLPLLMLMVVFSPLAIDIFLPALPIMAQDFSVAISKMQWSITVFLLSLGAGQLLAGPLADRYGRRPVAIVGVIIYGVSSLFSSYANSVEFFLFCRLLQGFGACAIVVAAFASVRDRFDPIQSGVMYSYLSSVICCVPAVAPLLGNMLTEQFGWRSNFEVMAAYAACAGIAIIFALPETRPENTFQHKKLISFARFVPILKQPIFIVNAVIIMLTMAIILAYVTASPGWLMLHLGESQQTFVAWFSVNAALNIVAYFYAPKVLLRLGARKTIGLGMTLLLASGLLMFALLGWNHAAAFMLPVMVSSIGISLLMGSCAGQALSPFGDSAGSASALLGFMQMSGAAALVSCVQLLPLTVPEQFILLTVTFVPVFAIWYRLKSTFSCASFS